MKDLVKQVKKQKARVAISKDLRARAIERLEVIQDMSEGGECRRRRQAEDVLLQVLKDLGAADVAFKFEEVRDDIGFWYS